MALTRTGVSGGGSILYETDDVEQIQTTEGEAIFFVMSSGERVFLQGAGTLDRVLIDSFGRADPGWTVHVTTGRAKVTLGNGEVEAPPASPDTGRIRLVPDTARADGTWLVTPLGTAGATIVLSRGTTATPAPATTLDIRAPGGRWGVQRTTLTDPNRRMPLEIRYTS